MVRSTRVPAAGTLMLALVFSVALAGDIDTEYTVHPTDDAMVRATHRQGQDLLDHYARTARSVYIGRVQAVQQFRDGAVPHDSAQIEVETTIRGRGRETVHVRIPSDAVTMSEKTPSILPPTDSAAGQSTYTPPAIVGQRVVVFLDRGDWVIDGDALYVIAGPLAWRSTNPETFMRPDQDRDWVDHLTPGPEWIRIETARISQSMETSRRRRRGRR